MKKHEQKKHYSPCMAPHIAYRHSLAMDALWVDVLWSILVQIHELVINGASRRFNRGNHTYSAPFACLDLLVFTTRQAQLYLYNYCWLGIQFYTGHRPDIAVNIQKTYARHTLSFRQLAHSLFLSFPEHRSPTAPACYAQRAFVVSFGGALCA